jgi:hypothetical protein
MGNEQELVINSNDFDNAQPAVSPDDKFLYFTSNRPGGYGGKDLYAVERRANRTYGTPRNLGPMINTFGEEQWPFVSTEKSLYFSSDGHIAFGDWIFLNQSLPMANGEKLKNMMFPFNTNKDDFGYVINPNYPREGFLSSNQDPVMVVSMHILCATQGRRTCG